MPNVTRQARLGSHLKTKPKKKKNLAAEFCYTRRSVAFNRRRSVLELRVCRRVIAVAAAKSPCREGLWTSFGRWRLLGPVEDSLKDDGFYLNAYFEVHRAGDFVLQLLWRCGNKLLGEEHPPREFLSTIHSMARIKPGYQHCDRYSSFRSGIIAFDNDSSETQISWKR